MQKLMVMRLCNTSECRRSTNYSQERLCWPKSGDNGSDFEHSGSWCPGVPHDVSPLLTTRALNGQPGWSVARPERPLPVLRCGRKRKDWGGHRAKGWLEVRTNAGACCRKARHGLITKWWPLDIQSAHRPALLPGTMNPVGILLTFSPSQKPLLWPHSPQPCFKRPLVSFLLLSPLGTWPRVRDWVSCLSTCRDICFRHRRQDLTHHLCVELLNLNAPLSLPSHFWWFCLRTVDDKLNDSTL